MIFLSGVLAEKNVFNADETHFLVDQHDGRALAMKGDERVSYADVFSGKEGMKMMMLLGGGAYKHLEAPFMIFKNSACSYLIQGLPENVPGVSYRSGKRDGWIAVFFWNGLERAEQLKSSQMSENE